MARQNTNTQQVSETSTQGSGSDTEGVESEDVMGREGKYLPPIYRLKLPTTNNKSTLIRWLYHVGYEVKDISKGLNIRYQQVRNIVKTIPKRAAREDMPADGIEVQEIGDALDMLMDAELDRTFLEAKKGKPRTTTRKHNAHANTATGNASTEVYDEEEDNDD
jgi:hypothetical protein